MAKILVVDEDRLRSTLLERILGERHKLTVVPTPQTAIDELRKGGFDIIFSCDTSRPDVFRKAREGGSRLFLVEIKAKNAPVSPERPRSSDEGNSHPDAIIFSDEYGWLSATEVLRIIDQALDSLNTGITPGQQAVRAEQSVSFGEEIDRLAQRAASDDQPVLIYGKPGTGKRTLARWIHQASKRGQVGGPFKTYSIASTESSTTELDLFGSEGTGLHSRDFKTPGLLELADTGSLFIGGANRLDARVQRKLLALVEDPLMRFIRCGGREPRRVDVRLFVATEEDFHTTLPDTAPTGLFWALSKIYIKLDPLHTRIQELSDFPHFTRDFNPEGIDISEVAKDMLKLYEWPHNFHEFKRAVQYALLRCDGTIREQDLPRYIQRAVNITLEQ